MGHSSSDHLSLILPLHICLPVDDALLNSCLHNCSLLNFYFNMGLVIVLLIYNQQLGPRSQLLQFNCSVATCRSVVVLYKSQVKTWICVSVKMVFIHEEKILYRGNRWYTVKAKSTMIQPVFQRWTKTFMVFFRVVKADISA